MDKARTYEVLNVNQTFDLIDELVAARGEFILTKGTTQHVFNHNCREKHP